MLTRCPGCGAYTWDGQNHCIGMSYSQFMSEFKRGWDDCHTGKEVQPASDVYRQGWAAAYHSMQDRIIALLAA